MRITYLPHVDGLRAIAVVSVVLYHCGAAFVPGGFIGVDIFFVISGYLITSIISNEVRSGRFSFRSFYMRRIRRLIPPLIPVLLITFIAAAALFNDPQFEDFVMSFFATNLFAANWYFLSTTGYFDGPADLKPLLHMWSLGVEEQFYILFPAALLLIRKSDRPTLPLIAGIGVLSLTLGIFLILTGQPEHAFFNSLGRFWEMLIGACLAVINLGRLSERAKYAMEWSGISLITLSIFCFSAEMPFPGFAALAPTIGTALIIAGGGGGHVGRAISTRPFVAIGLISYALYLWHWPLIVFTRYLFPDASFGTMLAPAGLAVLLATASYFLIELPIRGKRFLASLRGPVLTLAGTVSAAIGIGLVSLSSIAAQPRGELVSVAQSLFFDHRQTVALAAIADAETYYQSTLNKNFNGREDEFDLSRHEGWTCSFDRDNTAERVLECLVAQGGNSNILVAGDSIGRDTMHALRMAFPDQNFLMIHHSGCPPAERLPCFPELASVIGAASEQMNFDAIILAYRFRPNEWDVVEGSLPIFQAAAEEVFWFGASPMFAKPVAEYIREASSLHDEVPKSDGAMLSWDPYDLSLAAEMLAESSGVTFVNLSTFYCSETACPLWVDGDITRPSFWDRQHLTQHGIAALGRFLEDRVPL